MESVAAPSLDQDGIATCSSEHHQGPDHVSIPLRYLNEGNRLSEQGRQIDAVSMYERGLASVPENDSIYAQLADAKLCAQQRANRRIDFISELPLEIVEKIVHLLENEWSPADRHSSPAEIVSLLGPCGNVSHTWRARFVETHAMHMWISKHTTYNDPAARDTIMRVAPHVRRLVLSRLDLLPDTHLWSEACFDTLKTCTIDQWMPAFHNDAILSLLGSVGRTLTELSLYSSGKPVIRLYEILRACPNLVSFTCHDDLDANMTNIEEQSYLSMKTIKLHGASGISGNDEIRSFLKWFPLVRELNLVPSIGSEALATISENCALLRELKYGNQVDFDWPETGDSHPSGGCSNGLQVLHIADGELRIEPEDGQGDGEFEGPWYTEQNVMALMTCNADSLREFRLYGVILENDRPLQTAQSAFKFTHLTTLSFDPRGYAGCERLMVWIIRHAPNLRHLQLLETAVIDDILDALQSTNLHTLDIYMRQAHARRDAEALARVLWHYVDLGTASQLTTLHLSIYNNLDPSLIQAVAGIFQLREFYLVVRGPDDMQEAAHAVAFDKLVRKLNMLETMHWECREGIADALISQLWRLQSLKTLKLVSKKISEKGANGLLACRNLQYLEVYAHFVDYLIIHQLENKVPYFLHIDRPY